ncbi:MAG: bifunctional phosphoribosylaminoimidazolecarboxamide formyltransferase/IMP cyclohydrolase, partial [Acidocella sp. 20-61-6]
TQVQGKELSYNNYNDTDAAYECVAEFAEPALVILKHANPCGVAVAANMADAWDTALACDPVSAFGGIVALNRTLDEATAAKISTIFTEVIIAPDASPAAQALLAKKKNLRLLLTGGLPDPAQAGATFKSLAGGFLLQSRDAGRITPADLKIVTQRAPTEAEIADLIFAFRVCKHVKSNAIVYAKNRATIGVGAGQMNRVDSARIAAWRGKEAGLDFASCVVASDAFFPFADGLEAAISAGASAVIQPGGSIRDAEVIAAADSAGIAMVFTNMRHFRH